MMRLKAPQDGRFQVRALLSRSLKMPEAQRTGFCQKAGYKYDELAQLPQQDPLERLTGRDRTVDSHFTPS